MPQGIARRDGAQDRLEGATVEVTSSTAQPLRVPQVNTPDLINSQASRIGRALGEFTSQGFQEASTVQHEAAALDGQMAQMQGEAIDNVEMEGDKWKLAGYRIMDAQSLSSSMLAAQQEMIRQVQFSEDPDTFRSKFVNRLEQQIEGLDPQTARLVREQMSAQLPTLVAQHTQANLSYQEEEAYKSLERSVDVLGMDDIALDTYMSNIDGTGASGGLSQSRRQAAVTSGVVRAFQNGNGLAYARIQRSGRLNDFSTQDIAKMQSAQRAYQSKLRDTLNEDYVGGVIDLNTKLSTGEMTPEQAISARQELMATHGMEMTMAEGMAVGLEQEERNRLHLEGNSVLFRNAQLTNDWQTVADLSLASVVHFESRGNVNAVGPEIKSGANAGDRAQGALQVMPRTISDPGFGIRPADINNPEDVYRVGKEYWSVLVSGKQNQSGILKWEAGDVEAAAIAYNAGMVNANKWIAAGRDYSVLPKRSETEAYAKGILKDASGGERTVSAKNRLDVAQAAYDASKERLGVEAYTQLVVEQDQMVTKFHNGEMTEAEFFQESVRTLRRTQEHFTEAQINSTVSIIEKQRKAAASVLKEQGKSDTADRKEIYQATQDALASDYKVAMENPDLTPEERVQLTTDYQSASVQAIQDAGLTLAESDFSASQKVANDEMASAMIESRKKAVKDAVVTNAMNTGAVEALPGELRKDAFKKARESTQRTVSEAESKGVISSADIPRETAIQEIETWRRMGAVDPIRAAQNSTIMQPNRLLTADGNVNPQVVAVMEQYALALEDGNMDFAQSLFDNERSQLLAEQIMSLGNGEDFVQGVLDAGLSQDNVTRVAFDTDGNPTPATVQEALAMTDAMVSGHTTLSSSAFNRADVGAVQAVFSGKAAWSNIWDTTRAETQEREQFREVLKEATQGRIIELMKANPGFTAKEVSARAQRDIAARTSFIGGTVVIANKPSDSIRSQLFGSQAANWDAEHIEQEVIVDHLATLATENPEEFGFIDEILLRERLGPVASIPIAGLNLIGLGINPGTLGARGAFDAEVRDVRPFSVIQGKDQSGSNRFGVEIHTSDDRRRTVWIDLPAVGKEYMRKHKEQLTR